MRCPNDVPFWCAAAARSADRDAHHSDALATDARSDVQKPLSPASAEQSRASDAPVRTRTTCIEIRDSIVATRAEMEAVYRLALDTDRPVESLTRALDTAQMQMIGQYRKLSLTGSASGDAGSGSEGDEGLLSSSSDAASVANYVPLLVTVDSDRSGGSVTVKSEFFQKRKITEGRTYRVAQPAAKLPGGDAGVVLLAVGPGGSASANASGAAAIAASAAGAARGGGVARATDAAFEATEAAPGVAVLAATVSEASVVTAAGGRAEDRSAVVATLDRSLVATVASPPNVNGALSCVSLNGVAPAEGNVSTVVSTSAYSASATFASASGADTPSLSAYGAAAVAPAASVHHSFSITTPSTDVSSAVCNVRGNAADDSSAVASSGSMSTVVQSSVAVSTTVVVMGESVSAADPAAATTAGTAAAASASDTAANAATIETVRTNSAPIDDDEAEAAAIALRYRQSFEEAAARFERLAALGGAGDAPPATEASTAAAAASSRTTTAPSARPQSAGASSPLAAGGDSSSDDTGRYLPPSFVPASDESTAALWKAVDAFKQASTVVRTGAAGGTGGRPIEAGLCGDQLVIGYFSDATSTPSSAATGSARGGLSRAGLAGSQSGAAAAVVMRDKRRSDGLDRAAAAATERRAATMRAVHSASSFSGGGASADAARTESSTLMRRSRTEATVVGTAADGTQQPFPVSATTKSSSGSSGSGGGSSSIRNGSGGGGHRSRDAASDAESRDGKRASPSGTPNPGSRLSGDKNGGGGDRNGAIGVDHSVIRRSGLQYASFRQIRPPSGAIAADARKSSTARRSTTTTTTVTTNIYQLSVLPVFGSPAKDQSEPGHCSVLRNYTKGRPFVTYWVKLAIRDIKFDNASNLLISTRSSILMFDVNGYLLGEVFRDSIGEPYGLFVCENNDVLVADCKRGAVLEFDVMGRVVKTYGPVASPAGVAMARDGRVFVCSRWSRNPPCVAVFSPEGELLGRVGDEYLENPVSIALHGSLTIVCDGHYTVGIDRRGQVQFVYGREPSPGEAGSLPPAASVAVDPEGYVLVTDYCHHSVCGMTPEVDQAGIVLGEANECRHPCFVATSRFGHLAVVERHEGGYRVKLYKRNEKALKAK